MSQETEAQEGERLIYAWADGSWCDPEDLEGMLRYRSDDVMQVWVSGNASDATIDEAAYRAQSFGEPSSSDAAWRR